MRILIEPGSYRCQNLGDIAMLQVAVQRLRATWPDARLYVMTNAPTALRRVCRGVKPLSTAGRALWFEERRRRGRNRRVGLANYTHLVLDRRDPRKLWHFVHTFQEMDLLVIAGQGSMTDATQGHAADVLGTLELAAEHDIPAIMVGQGIGPLIEPALVERARGVLPGVRMIGLREGCEGPEVLQRIGVPADRFRVTGDSAIALAVDAAPTRLGRGLGINVRISVNAGVERSVLAAIRRALLTFADARGAPFVPAPIGMGQAGDAAVIRELLKGHTETDGSAGFGDPSEVIAQLGGCRVLFTGAYHAAVFALSQGIPTVCLSGSSYYQAKFDGLRDLFGDGCFVVSATEDGLDGLADRITAALVEAWERAEALREPLRRAARGQVEREAALYGALPSLVTGPFPSAASSEAIP